MELKMYRFRASLTNEMQETLWISGEEQEAPVFFFNAMTQLKQRPAQNESCIIKNFYRGQLCRTDASMMRTANQETLNLLRMMVRPGSEEEKFLNTYL